MCGVFHSFFFLFFFFFCCHALTRSESRSVDVRPKLPGWTSAVAAVSQPESKAYSNSSRWSEVTVNIYSVNNYVVSPSWTMSHVQTLWLRSPQWSKEFKTVKNSPLQTVALTITTDFKFCFLSFPPPPPHPTPTFFNPGSVVAFLLCACMCVWCARTTILCFCYYFIGFMYSFLLILLSMVCSPLSVRFYAIEMASINIICVSIETLGQFRQGC